ncbi:MAG: hypothetical protein V1779_15815 [bacterium]
MKTFILFICFGIVLVSCYDNILVDPRRGYSNLKIKVFNKDNSPAGGSKVLIKMYLGRGSVEQDNAPTIVDDSTDMNGEFSTKLLEGEYIIETRIYYGYAYYSTSNGIQMIGGLDRYRELRPYDNVGQITFLIQNSKGQPVPDINIVLLSKIYKNKVKFNDYLKLFFMSGKTDTSGRIIFNEVPNKYIFGLIIYRNDSLFYTSSVGYSTSSLYDDNINKVFINF